MEQDFSPHPRHRGGHAERLPLDLFDGVAYGPTINEQWTNDIRNAYGDDLSTDFAPDVVVPDLPISGPTILRNSFAAIQEARQRRQQEELPLE